MKFFLKSKTETTYRGGRSYTMTGIPNTTPITADYNGASVLRLDLKKSFPDIAVY